MGRKCHWRWESGWSLPGQAASLNPGRLTAVLGLSFPGMEGPGARPVSTVDSSRRPPGCVMCGRIRSTLRLQPSSLRMTLGAPRCIPQPQFPPKEGMLEPQDSDVRGSKALGLGGMDISINISMGDVSHTLGVQRGKLRPGKAQGVARPSTRLRLASLGTTRPSRSLPLPPVSRSAQ